MTKWNEVEYPSEEDIKSFKKAEQPIEEAGPAPGYRLLARLVGVFMVLVVCVIAALAVQPESAALPTAAVVQATPTLKPTTRPTATAQPTATFTATPWPSATATAAPTETPLPTVTLASTETPLPSVTASPLPSETAPPSETPEAAPLAAATPTVPSAVTITTLSGGDQGQDWKGMLITFLAGVLFATGLGLVFLAFYNLARQRNQVAATPSPAPAPVAVIPPPIVNLAEPEQSPLAAPPPHPDKEPAWLRPLPPHERRYRRAVEPVEPIAPRVELKAESGGGGQVEAISVPFNTKRPPAPAERAYIRKRYEELGRSLTATCHDVYGQKGPKVYDWVKAAVNEPDKPAPVKRVGRWVQ